MVEPMVAVVAADHPLAGRDAIDLAELRDDRFITFREGAGLRRILGAAAAQAGFTPQVAFESNNVLRGCALASQGLGVSIVPASDAAAAESAGRRRAAQRPAAARRDARVAPPPAPLAGRARLP